MNAKSTSDALHLQKNKKTETKQPIPNTTKPIPEKMIPTPHLRPPFNGEIPFCRIFGS